MVGSAIKDIEIVRRYTRALLDLAKEYKAEKSVERDLKELQSMIASSPDLGHSLANPTINCAHMKAFLNSLAEKAGFHTVTQGFLEVVAIMGRSYLLQQIATLFADHRDSAQGFHKIQITLASTPSLEEKKSIMQMLEDLLGSRLRVVWECDKRILGGLRIQLGSYMIDASLGSWFEQMSLAMKTGE